MLHGEPPDGGTAVLTTVCAIQLQIPANIRQSAQNRGISTPARQRALLYGESHERCRELRSEVPPHPPGMSLSDSHLFWVAKQHLGEQAEPTKTLGGRGDCCGKCNVKLAVHIATVTTSTALVTIKTSSTPFAQLFQYTVHSPHLNKVIFSGWNSVT